MRYPAMLVSGLLLQAREVDPVRSPAWVALTIAKAAMKVLKIAKDGLSLRKRKHIKGFTKESNYGGFLVSGQFQEREALRL